MTVPRRAALVPFFVAAVAASFLLGTVPAVAGTPAEAEPESWSAIIQDLILHWIPQDYTDDRHWGQTARITSGVRIRTKGGQIRLQPREKEVNHGLWRRVSIRLLHPERTFHLEIRNWRLTEDGARRFELVLQVRARCDTQFALWAYGVKGLNGSVESDVTVVAVADCSYRLETRRTAGHWLPELIVFPQVHDLRLKLTDIDARQIGPIGGWVADELGNASRRTVEDLLQSQEHRILARIRKRLDQDEGRMTIDPYRWTSPRKIRPVPQSHRIDSAPGDSNGQEKEKS